MNYVILVHFEKPEVTSGDYTPSAVSFVHVSFSLVVTGNEQIFSVFICIQKRSS